MVSIGTKDLAAPAQQFRTSLQMELLLVLCLREFYPTRIMDLSKYPLEKLVYFAAGVIPGFVAILIYHVASPGSFGWFFALGFLGYRTKLGLILLVAFVVGNSMTTFLASFLGGIGGAIGTAMALRPYKPPHTYDVAPWREPTWRALVRTRLGTQAPNDTRRMTQEDFDLRVKIVNLQPEEQRPLAFVDLSLEKLHAEMDDANWAQWYEHYHQIVVFREKPDLQWHVRYGLNFNLQTAGLYVLISAAVVPDVRHWWSIVPATLWILVLAAQEYAGVWKVTNKWSTLPDQMKYLSGDS